MTRTERFSAVMNILETNDLCNCSMYHTMFDTLRDEEITDNEKVQNVLSMIREYEKYKNGRNNKYPENIMRDLRRRRGLDEFDISEDNDIINIRQERHFQKFVIGMVYLAVMITQ